MAARRFGAERRLAPRGSASTARGQRGAKAAARRQVARRRHRAAISASRSLARLDPDRGIAAQQRRACRDAAAGRTASRPAPRSTSRPAYMTTTRSAISATTPRSWVMSMMRRAELVAAGPRSSSRICAWMVTSSAVVGSSAMSSRARRRAPCAIIDALAHAAGQLVRIFVERAAPGRGCRRRSQQSRSRGARASRRDGRGAAQRLRRSGRRSVSTGLSDGHRLLEDHRDPVAAQSSHLAPGKRTQIAPSSRIAPPITRAACGSSRMSDSAVIDLPQPDSPTRRTASRPGGPTNAMLRHHGKRLLAIGWRRRDRGPPARWLFSARILHDTGSA